MTHLGPRLPVRRWAYMAQQQLGKFPRSKILVIMVALAIVLTSSSLLISQSNSKFSLDDTKQMLQPLVESSAGTVGSIIEKISGGGDGTIGDSDHHDAKNKHQPGEDAVEAHSKLERPPYIDYSQQYAADDLRRKLKDKFEYDRDSVIPRVIYQSWGPEFDDIGDMKVKKKIESWKNNDRFQHVYLSDTKMQKFLLEEFGEFPEILQTYSKLPVDILRFDFVRYLLLFAKGGIYTDIDTSTITELEKWIDIDFETQFPLYLSNEKYTFNAKDIGFVAGIESDYDREDWKHKAARRVQFCQWTFKSKKGHPILRELINMIVRTTLDNFSQRLNHVKINDEYFTLHSIYTILEWTGPGMFTDAIFDHFNKIFSKEMVYINHNKQTEVKFKEFEAYNKDKNVVNIDKGKMFGWTNFTRLQKPVLIDDTLILPINSFNGFVDDLEFPIDNSFTYLKHAFHGSWKELY